MDSFVDVIEGVEFLIVSGLGVFRRDQSGKGLDGKVNGLEDKFIY